MRLFTRTTLVTVGLLAAVTSIGVYGATAGNSIAIDRPAGLDANGGHASDAPTSEISDGQNAKTIRIVGPRFFPDNGNIKLHGASGSIAVAD